MTLKNGCLTSSPRTSSLNNLCVFLCSPEGKGNSLSAEIALRLQEQASYGKLNSEDISLLTRMKAYVPYDYASFIHMLRNIKFLCNFIGGDNCMSSIAWSITLTHALRNECLYREEFLKNKHFYVSLLDDYHRRFQTFIQSCAFDEVDQLRHSQLKFEKLCDSIELFEYMVRTPSWLLKRSRPEQSPQTTPTYTLTSSETKRPRSNTTLRSSSGEKVVNLHIDPQMQPPRTIRFGALFNPENRDGTKTTNQPDGQFKCNNYHHRGFCWSTCRYKHSHDKTLTSSELTVGRKYLADLLGKYNAGNNTKNPTVPNGTPPKPKKPTGSPKQPSGESPKGPN